MLALELLLVLSLSLIEFLKDFELMIEEVRSREADAGLSSIPSRKSSSLLYLSRVLAFLDFRYYSTSSLFTNFAPTTVGS